MKTKSKLFIILILLVIPLVSSMTINSGTSFISSPINLNITFYSTAYADQVSVNSNNITFYNYSIDNSLNTISFPVTQNNVNLSSSNLPYFSSGTNTYLITSNINSSNDVIYLSANCNLIGKINYISASGVSYSFVNGFFIKAYNCNNNQVSFNQLFQVDKGVNTFTISYDNGALTACQNSVSAFISYIGLIGLLGVLIFLSLVISYIAGIIDKDKFKNYSIISSVVTLIMISVLVIVAIILFVNLCNSL